MNKFQQDAMDKVSRALLQLHEAGDDAPDATSFELSDMTGCRLGMVQSTLIRMRHQGYVSEQLDAFGQFATYELTAHGLAVLRKVQQQDREAAR